jgi:hypothetical protein
MILAGIPGMNEDILPKSQPPHARTDRPDAGRRSETWLLAEGIVTLEEMKAMMPYVNAGGSVLALR